jgi:hypothetical protein
VRRPPLSVRRDPRVELVTYEVAFDLRTDDVAAEYDADKLLTGHNLDDETQTALTNFFYIDVEQMATTSTRASEPSAADRSDESPDRDGTSTRVSTDGPLVSRVTTPRRAREGSRLLRPAEGVAGPRHRVPRASEAYRGEI